MSEPLRISDDAKRWMTRRQWARLWGQKHMIKPVFIEKYFGDGQRFVAITPLNTKPNYYLIRVDSGWSMRNTDESCIADHIDDICDAIEDEVGTKYDSESDKSFPWPALDDEVGVAWCDSMDLIEAAKHAVAKIRKQEFRMLGVDRNGVEL